MKIIYKFDTEELFETDEQNIVPSVGQLVYLDDEYFVETVLWNPRENEVYVFLSYEPQKKPKVEKVKENVVKLNDFSLLKKSTDKALKETAELKRQVFSMKQYINQRGMKDKT